MTYETLLYEVDAEHICWITLNRPDKLNAMNVRMITELRRALERADEDAAVNVIVLRGGRPRLLLRPRSERGRRG